MASQGDDDDRAQVGSSGCFWTTFAGHLSGTAAPAPSQGGGGGVGGSFWQLFDQMDFAVPSPIDILLEQKDCPVDALLREEDVLQELRARHRGLISRLSQADAAAVLIDCVTREPPPNSQPQSQPFVAVQLLTCDVPELFEVWVSPEHPGLLDRFWRYLDQTPSESTRLVLAGYFSTVAMVLLERYPEEVAADLRRRGADDILDRLITRLDSRSIAELLACIAAAEWRSRIVFRTQSLVDRLLGVLKSDSASRDSQEHAQLIISELLARGGTLCFAEELLTSLTSAGVVEPLLQLLLAGPSHQASAASAVLAAAAFHTGGGGEGAKLEYGQSFSSLSPLGGPGSRRGEDGLDDLAAAAEEEFRELENVLPKTSTCSIPASLVSGAIEMQCTQLVSSVCAQISGIRGLLEAAAAPAPGKLGGKTAAPASNRAAGAVSLANVLEVILVLTLLLKARREEVLAAFKREDVLTTCMKLLLHRPWCTLLHNAVGSLFSEVLRAADTLAVALVKGFASKGGVLDMLVAEYRQKQKCFDSSCPGRSHAGYFGHLHNLVLELQAFGEQHRAASGERALLLGVAGWKEVVAPAVESVRRLHGEDLGGGIPPEVRALACSNILPLMQGSGSDVAQLTDGFPVPPGEAEPIQIDFDSAGGEGGEQQVAKAANASPDAAAVAAGSPRPAQKTCCVLL